MPPGARDREERDGDSSLWHESQRNIDLSATPLWGREGRAGEAVHDAVAHAGIVEAVAHHAGAADLTARADFDANGQSALERGVGAERLLVTAARLTCAARERGLQRCGRSAAALFRAGIRPRGDLGLALVVGLC